MDREKFKELVDIALEKTNDGFLAWEEMHEEGSFRASLGKVYLIVAKGEIRGGDSYGRDWVQFKLTSRRGDVLHEWNVNVDRDFEDVGTAFNPPTYDWALEAWEVARSSAKGALEQVDDAMKFLAKLGS